MYDIKGPFDLDLPLLDIPVNSHFRPKNFQFLTSCVTANTFPSDLSPHTNMHFTPAYDLHTQVRNCGNSSSGKKLLQTPSFSSKNTAFIQIEAPFRNEAPHIFGRKLTEFFFKVDIC